MKGVIGNLEAVYQQSARRNILEAVHFRSHLVFR